MPVSLNPTIEARINDLLEQMTLDEKIGQMTQVEKNSISPSEVNTYHIGSVLSGGGGYPPTNSPTGWINMVSSFQEAALESRLGIPLLYGVDAVHGHNNLLGATIYPHNIGLGAANNPELISLIARATAEEMLATGVRWNFAPTVAVPQDIRWGRTYEGFSENTELVTRSSTAYIRGLQGEYLSSPGSVMASAKHYVGDGGTAYKSSTSLHYLLDRGITNVNEATLRKGHLPPYIEAVREGVMCVMASFSSWNGQKMSANRYLLTDVLRNELQFNGFVVSDWQAIDEVSPDYYQAVVQSIYAGIDMSMVPFDYKRFISTLKQAVEQGDLNLRRINEAVQNILNAKLTMGLFDHPFPPPGYIQTVGSEAHRYLARRAVRESLVLLKNNHQCLPISRNLKTIFIGGKGADNLGMQCGGWTIEWLGIDGNQIPGTTILQGVRNKVSPQTSVIYQREGVFERSDPALLDIDRAELGIAVVGEMPYAEGLGDRQDLSLSDLDVELIHRMRAKCDHLVVILISGRPMIITDILPMFDAFVCAWLPGQEGEGIADVLFGEMEFKGKLPYTWPKSMDQLPFDSEEDKNAKVPLFPFGYGLATS